MARIEEATLFRPDPKLQYPGTSRSGGGGGGGGRGGGGGGRGDDDDDGPNIAVKERVAEAARSAKRRKGLSFVVVMICGALTVLGAIFAPRNYEVEARVLVQRTQVITGGQGQQLSAEEMRNIAKEYEEQVMAHDNIIAIVRQKNLVSRWDDMRQPHRRLIDKINRKLGKAAPSDDEKYDALVTNIQNRLKVWVDATTVTVKLEWSEPEAARDIVDAAVKNFLEARFQSEVGVIPERLKILEAGVTQAHKDLETSASELVRQQKLANPRERVNIVIPNLPQGVKDRPIVDEAADPAVKARLEGIRQQVAVLQEAKLRREAELNQELIQKRQTLAEGHPEIIALKQTIDATRADPPQLAKLKAEEREILNEIAAKQRAAAEARAAEPKPVAPRVVAPAPVAVETPTAGSTKSVQDAQVQFDAVTRKYTDLVNQLDAARIEMKTAEAAFKNRYKVVHPAEIPAGPKRPVGLIAIAIGVLSTIAAVLAVAALADRFSGIFFEPRDVRDRLGLPVFATFS
ncbi:MAG: Chain length determinant protein [Labilithrix sp.]|nr:Chain length determinant protein [Labilithrix sp.]